MLHGRRQFVVVSRPVESMNERRPVCILSVSYGIAKLCSEYLYKRYLYGIMTGRHGLYGVGYRRATRAVLTSAKFI